MNWKYIAIGVVSAAGLSACLIGKTPVFTATWSGGDNDAQVEKLEKWLKAEALKDGGIEDVHVRIRENRAEVYLSAGKLGQAMVDKLHQRVLAAQKAARTTLKIDFLPEDYDNVKAFKGEHPSGSHATDLDWGRSELEAVHSRLAAPGFLQDPGESVDCELTIPLSRDIPELRYVFVMENFTRPLRFPASLLEKHVNDQASMQALGAKPYGALSPTNFSVYVEGIQFSVFGMRIQDYKHQRWVDDPELQPLGADRFWPKDRSAWILKTRHLGGHDARQQNDPSRICRESFAASFPGLAHKIELGRALIGLGPLEIDPKWKPD